MPGRSDFAPTTERWLREFFVTFAKVKPDRQAGTTVMRQMAIVWKLYHRF